MDKFETIKQYKELLDMGVITRQEFEDKKNELFEFKAASYSVKKETPQNETTGEDAAENIKLDETEATLTTTGGMSEYQGLNEDDKSIANENCELITSEAPVQTETVPKGSKKVKFVGIGIILLIGIVALLIYGMGDALGVSGKLNRSDSIDYVEPSNADNSFTFNGSVINLAKDWEFEQVSDFYVIYLNGKNTTDDKFFVLSMKDAIKGATDDEQVSNYYDIFVPQFMKAYPNAKKTLGEHIERDGKPAYHLVLYDEVAKVTYESFMFMSNDTDMLIAMKSHIDSAASDNTDAFMEFVRGIKISQQ